MGTSNKVESSKITSFTDLSAWREAHNFAVMLYQETKGFPVSEQFGLTAQLRRCAVSVTSNIAEGFSRRTKADKAHFYTIALGSVTEIQSQLLIAKDVGYLEKTNFDKLADKIVVVQKLIGGLIKSAETRRNK